MLFVQAKGNSLSEVKSTYSDPDNVLTPTNAFRFPNEHPHRVKACHQSEAVQKRLCLCCRQEFDSEGTHNRLCCRCKSTDAYRGASLEE